MLAKGVQNSRIQILCPGDIDIVLSLHPPQHVLSDDQGVALAAVPKPSSPNLFNFRECTDVFSGQGNINRCVRDQVMAKDRASRPGIGYQTFR